MTAEARLLAAERQRLSEMSWDEAKWLIDQQVYCEFLTSPGEKLAVETTGMWDDMAAGTIRLVVDVIDAREFTPNKVGPLVTAVFLKEPGGRLVGD